jgi:hypothetical protein
MKLLVVVAVIFWFICGLGGAWLLEGSDMHFKTVARGPISLIKGFQDDPVTVPGP